MGDARRFEKGSGVYKCRGCGRKTRSTGRGDNENVQMCTTCYDEAGFENEHSDGGHQSGDYLEECPTCRNDKAAQDANRDLANWGITSECSNNVGGSSMRKLLKAMKSIPFPTKVMAKAYAKAVFGKTDLITRVREKETVVAGVTLGYILNVYRVVEPPKPAKKAAKTAKTAKTAKDA